MINQKRMVDEFLKLVEIDSITREERNMANVLSNKLKKFGFSVYEDDAGKKIGGNSGNLICTLNGNSSNKPCILFMAHMDTVVPGKGKKGIVEDGYIKSCGNTILGGDDVAGIECIMEAIRVIKEEQIEHGDIQVVFSVAEEGGLNGAKNMDFSKIYAKYGFVLDCEGHAGKVSICAPTQYHMYVTIKGKAAHAGIEPQNGVNAIQIASYAISNMKLGRIDEETTANIGIIKGGLATNIVCDCVEIKAEVRSRNSKKLQNQLVHMQECFETAAEEFGGKVSIITKKMYSSYRVGPNEEIIDILRKAAYQADVPLRLEETCGGSDTNILNEKGIKSVNLSIGMEKVHSVEERISIWDMTKTARLLVEIIKNVE